MGRTLPLSLTSEQRRELEELASQRSLKQGHARRVRVVLLAADGVAGVEIGRRLSLSEFAVSRIRRRFEEGGVAGLADRPKPGRGNDLPLEIVGKILSAVMSAPPKGHSHWSTGLLARKFGIGRTTAHKVLRENDLKPDQHRTFTRTDSSSHTAHRRSGPRGFAGAALFLPVR
ncbi:MAG TPA: helix-turn-helix domain-containing protein [Polyangia bacterium]